MRYKNGEIMAKADQKRGLAQDIDYVAGVPDSGIPHAIGYANACHVPFARPFMQIHAHLAALLYARQPEGAQPGGQDEADPVPELIEGKSYCLSTIPLCAAPSCVKLLNSCNESGAPKSTCARPARRLCMAANT
ncbi:MAG: hypothetical protein ACLSF2_06530 [Butyricicoccus sp.]